MAAANWMGSPCSTELRRLAVIAEVTVESTVLGAHIYDLIHHCLRET